MARDISVDASAQVDADAVRVVELYDAYFKDETRRYTTNNEDVTFWDPDGGGPYTYSPISVKREQLQRSGTLQIDQVVIALGSVEESIAQYLEGSNIVGCRFVIRKLFLDAMSAADDAITMMEGLVGGVVISGREASLSILSYFSVFNQVLPATSVSYLCRWGLGSTYCTLDLTASPQVETGTVGAGTTASQIVDAGRAEASDWWKFGEVEMTSGSLEGENRKVKDSAAGTVDMSMPFSATPSVGDTYEIRIGCSKELGRCQAFSNEANFGGFHTVPYDPYLR